MKYLSLNGLKYFWSKLKARLRNIEVQLPTSITGYDININSGAVELWSQNLNTVTKTGLYNAITCKNAKYQYSTLLVIGYYLDGYCTQIQTDVTSGAIATRTQINGSWTTWRVIS